MDFKFCVSTPKADIWRHEDRLMLRDCAIEQIFVDHPVIMRKNVSRDDVARLKKELEDDGLVAMSSHPPFGSFNDPFSLIRQSAAGRKSDIEWLKEYIVRCGILGIPSLPFHTGGAMLPDAPDWCIESGKDYIRELLPIAEKAGVVLAIENTNHADAVGFYPGVESSARLNDNIWKFDDTDRILDFVHGFDSPFVRICYDTGHSHLLGKMLADLDAFFDDTVLFHIHDNDGAGDDSHVQPGYGNSDWAAFFDKIGKYESAPVIYVEAPPYFGDKALMMRELSAICEGRVTVKRGGYLLKDEGDGRIVMSDRREK